VFKGVSEYLEDLMSGIDAPQLGELSITFFHQLIFDTPQLIQFISRIPTLGAHNTPQARHNIPRARHNIFRHNEPQAHLVFDGGAAYVTVPRLNGMFRIGTLCRQLDWQLSALAQLCASSFPQILIPTVEHLYIVENPFFHWQDDIENSRWLEILHPFTGVKDLYLSREFVPRVAPSLQELVGGRVTESLPVLQGIHLGEGYRKSQPVEKAIGEFVGTR